MPENETAYRFKRFSKKNGLIVAVVTLAYILLANFLIGLKSDQFVLTGIFIILYFGNSFSRKLILGLSIFIVYWIVFDFMKAFPNYSFNEVHIEDLYQFEKKLFGINHAGTVITPNEFWIQHQSALLDALSGIFYLCWVPVPLLFALYLFYKNKEQFLRFSITFFWVNILGFIIHYIYPASPPWYMQQFGTAFNPHTLGNTAGLSRFDSMFHVSVFHSLYTKSSNVFAAMPSLHSAYPVIVLYYGLKNRLGLINIVFAIVVAGIWFAAVYTSHHYVLDVIAGVCCAAIGIFSIERIFLHKTIDKLLQHYLRVIE